VLADGAGISALRATAEPARVRVRRTGGALSAVSTTACSAPDGTDTATATGESSVGDVDTAHAETGGTELFVADASGASELAAESGTGDVSEAVAPS
jgi:hypothetical protein